MSKSKGSAEDISQALFEISERVLCFHGPLIYEGKVLKIQSKEKEISYWIHYAGWSKSWDEWVPEKRVLKWTEDNLKKQSELKQALEDHAKGKKGIAKPVTVNKKKSVGSVGGDSSSGNLSTTDSRSSTPILDAKVAVKVKAAEPPKLEDESKKRKRNEFVEPEQTFETKQEVSIPLPDPLKTFLVDDWDFITRQKRLVNIPARNTVDSILGDYLKYVKENKPDDASTVEDLCTGIKEYFNVMVGNQLMYRYERQQMSDFEQKCKDDNVEVPLMSSVYGASHLLRLFTKLGGCLAYTTMDADAIEILCKCFDDFVKFLETNYKVYFSVDDYGAAPPEYQRKGKKPFPPQIVDAVA